MNEREWDIRYWIKERLLGELTCAKRNLRFSAEREQAELTGMLHYMFSVGDISEETFKKVYKISRLIIKNYF